MPYCHAPWTNIDIDPEGKIRRVYRNVSPSNHAQEIKNDLEAFERNS